MQSSKFTGLTGLRHHFVDFLENIIGREIKKGTLMLYKGEAISRDSLPTETRTVTKTDVGSFANREGIPIKVPVKTGVSAMVHGNPHTYRESIPQERLYSADKGETDKNLALQEESAEVFMNFVDKTPYSIIEEKEDEIATIADVEVVHVERLNRAEGISLKRSWKDWYELAKNSVIVEIPEIAEEPKKRKLPIKNRNGEKVVWVKNKFVPAIQIIDPKTRTAKYASEKPIAEFLKENGETPEKNKHKNIAKALKILEDQYKDKKIFVQYGDKINGRNAKKVAKLHGISTYSVVQDPSQETRYSILRYRKPNKYGPIIRRGALVASGVVMGVFSTFFLLNNPDARLRAIGQEVGSLLESVVSSEEEHSQIEDAKEEAKTINRKITEKPKKPVSSKPVVKVGAIKIQDEKHTYRIFLSGKDPDGIKELIAYVIKEPETFSGTPITLISEKYSGKDTYVTIDPNPQDIEIKLDKGWHCLYARTKDGKNNHGVTSMKIQGGK